jgi:acyl-CoA thioester hydrolase
MAPTWSAPVRFVEVDGQGIVFNAHYLTWCDEAMTAFARIRGLPEFSAAVRLVTSTLTWSGPATWGDTVAVQASCTAVGRSSVTMSFAITADERAICTVQTVYVHTDADGTPRPVPDDVRAALLAAG